LVPVLEAPSAVSRALPIYRALESYLGDPGKRDKTGHRGPGRGRGSGHRAAPEQERRHAQRDRIPKARERRRSEAAADRAERAAGGDSPKRRLPCRPLTSPPSVVQKTSTAIASSCFATTTRIA
jgi:hypothetical protein